MPGMEEFYWLARQVPPATKLLLFNRSTRLFLTRLGCGTTGWEERTTTPLIERSVIRSSNPFHPWQISHAPSARFWCAWSHLAREGGICQFLGLGTGLPTHKNPHRKGGA